MKKHTNIIVSMMLEMCMCMWTCCVRMICCAHHSDGFSDARENFCAA